MFTVLDRFGDRKGMRCYATFKSAYIRLMFWEVNFPKLKPFTVEKI